MLQVIRHVVGIQATNTYLVFNENKEGILIDPASHGKALIQAIEKEGVQLEAILLTHAHGDHIGALNEVRDHFQVEVYMAQEEEEVYLNPGLNMAAMMGLEEPNKKVDHYIKDGEILPFKLGDIKAYLTPGHTPGSMCFLIEDLLFSGDTLFEGSIGRTDFPGGSLEAMMTSLRKLVSFDDGIRVLPGHGEGTTMEREKRLNPFLRRL
ncbi:MAG: MBL fold metallo-hydrolase [Tissierellia bacterium]|nr:MBL fold metallo-hydrolase [Tissierellia bacterium]